MSVYLPKKLPTSIGIELTYMPRMAEQLHQTLGAEGFKVWDSAEYAYRPFADALKFCLERAKIKVFKCTTDPGCVEVPTMPYKTANGIREAIRKVSQQARRVGLSPVSSYSIGGGAHIHTGLIGSRGSKEQDIYVGLMQLFQARNPWFAWAFAGKNDSSNAQAFHREELTRSEDNVTAETCERRIQSCQQDIETYKEHLAQAYTRMHFKENWQNQRGWNWSDILDDFNLYRRMLGNERKDLLKWTRKYKELTDQLTCKDYLMPYNRIRHYEDKNRVVVKRANTMEFRCFRMPATNKGMDYLIAIACEVVKQCRDEMQLMMELGVNEVDTRGTLTKDQMRAMKYSEAKRGFNAMLRTLDLEPADYREYCVNIALRMRYRRTKGTV